jgi:hypothetical protein
MEIAMVADNGARTGRCEFCGDIFLTGSLTGNRPTKIYCSEKHRVYGNRAKAEKAKGGRHVGAKAQMDDRRRRGSRSLGR